MAEFIGSERCSHERNHSAYFSVGDLDGDIDVFIDDSVGVMDPRQLRHLIDALLSSIELMRAETAGSRN